MHHQRTAGLATSAAKQAAPSPTLGLSSLVLLAPCGVTLFLGLWQLQRREQKIAMLAERRNKLAAPPLSLAELLASQGNDDSAQDLEFRRVELTGTYDRSRSMFVGPRVKSAPGGMTEKGFHVVTPLVPEDERAPPVLVNRGWVPNDWTEAPGGDARVTVCGVVRGSDQPSQFVPPNAPERGDWFFIDAPRMARETGIGDDALLIEATSDVGSRPAVARYPEPRDPFELAKFRIMPQDHLNYAMTWLTLFAAVSTMAYMRLFGRSSRRKQVVLKYKDGP